MCSSSLLAPNVLGVLGDYLRDAGAQLVLAGSQAETGEGSGMLPFLLAEKLGWPLVVGLAEVESIDNGTAQVLQALPRGQRRRLKVRLPLLATVDNAAPKPRQSAFGPARRVCWRRATWWWWTTRYWARRPCSRRGPGPSG